MSEVLEGTSGPMRASNTVNTLYPTDVYQAAVPAVDAAASDVSDTQVGTTDEAAAAMTQIDAIEHADGDDAPLDDESALDVCRAEFKELQDGFLHLMNRISEHNKRSPHKI